MNGKKICPNQDIKFWELAWHMVNGNKLEFAILKRKNYLEQNSANLRTGSTGQVHFDNLIRSVTLSHIWFSKHIIIGD